MPLCFVAVFLVYFFCMSNKYDVCFFVWLNSIIHLLLFLLAAFIVDE